MGSPASIGINDDLSSSKSSISSGSSHNEGTRGIDNKLGLGQHFSGAYLSDNLLDQSVFDSLVVNTSVVLGGYEDVIDRDWFHSSSSLLVFYYHLRLAVRSKPWNFSTVSLGCHVLADSVGKQVREREEVLLVPLIGGVAEHESLISGSHVLDGLVGMDRVGNLRRLSLDLEKNVAGVAVEANFGGSVADLLAYSPGNSLVVNGLFAGDFSKKSNLSS